uniref:Type III restriction enzyme, res subunit n=1 Tax=Mimiviridae sp. ChoanoV1 TaxID=2596887 RepID=A0A5B8HYF2_9VIRU|nr:type III restriction enzyme, res subunit [Mimiviridae sp. ChoanoV1]
MDKSNLFEFINTQLNIFEINYYEKFEKFKSIPLEHAKPLIDSYNYTDLPNNIEFILKNDDGLRIFRFILDYIHKTIDYHIINNENEISIKDKLYEKNPIIDNKYYKIILDWLIEEKFIKNCIDNTQYKTIDLEDIPEDKINLDKFIPRVNQQEAFDRLEENGLETGIHCQATGCGKTFIIIRYIDYCIRNFGNECKIILFTERVNILADLFDLTKKRLTANKKNIENWFKIGVGDLRNLDIINRVTVKTKDWVEKLNKSKKPTLLVINRAFLTLRKSYKKLNPITLILHDECHNTTSKQCHTFLLNSKSKNIPIVGFSATPLRTGKEDLSKLREIYLENGESEREDFPLLTNYSMVYAISNNLILPPEFYWYHISNSDRKSISDGEIATVMEILNDLVTKMPNRKIVAWCGRIQTAIDWIKIFKKEHTKRTNLTRFKFFLDTSQNDNQDYRNFKKIDSDAILFCANKHREGSDIRRLDGCIFIDKVKNRGSIPFIQSIGRVLRLDKDNTGKKNGFVIDGIFKNENYDRAFIDKILGYYMNLENSLCKLEDLQNERSKYDKYIQLKHMINFSKNKQEITINLGGQEIKIFLNQLDWNDVIERFDSILQNRIKLSAESNMKHKGRMLVEHFNFNQRTNFLEEYKSIPEEKKREHNFPDIESEEYQSIFCNKTWFDFLGIEHNFYSDMKEARRRLEEKKIKLSNAKENWHKWCEEDEKLPPYPEYVFDNWGKDSFQEFEEKKIVNLFV